MLRTVVRQTVKANQIEKSGETDDGERERDDNVDVSEIIPFGDSVAPGVRSGLRHYSEIL